MTKHPFDRMLDEEGYVHLAGSGIAVNKGLCGYNGSVENTLKPCNCNGCLATIRHVYAQLWPPEAGKKP